MTPPLKIMFGLAAALLAGWISHGPLGRGAAFIDQIEAGSRAAIAQSDVPGITVTVQRDPLQRTAFLSGPANQFQRDGLGSLPGLTGRVAAVPGIHAVRWTNPPPAR